MRRVSIAAALVLVTSGCDPDPAGPEEEVIAPLPFLEESAVLRITSFTPIADECQLYGATLVGQRVELQVNEGVDARSYSMLVRRPLLLSTLHVGTAWSDGLVHFGSTLEPFDSSAPDCVTGAIEHVTGWLDGGAVRMRFEVAVTDTCGALPIPAPCTSTADAILTPLAEAS